MTDLFDKKTRSKIMASIKSKNTKLEIKFRKQLYHNGIKGYRLYYNLPGKPDIVFTKYKLAIFIDGDFWHGYNWKVRSKIPPNKKWKDKIQRNIDRDKENNEALTNLGWTVLRFWEHEIEEDIGKCLNIVKAKMTQFY